MKSFIITFDTTSTEASVAHDIITKLPEAKKWWHYINGTYIITSTSTAKQIHTSIKSKWPGGRYLVVEVTGRADGKLPVEAWDWINTNVPR